MPRISFIFYFLLSGLFLFQSCTIEKRRYLGGYYVHRQNNIPSKTFKSVTNLEGSPVFIKQVKQTIEVADLKEKDLKKTLLASADKKKQPVIPYKQITLPVIGDSCDTIVLRNNVEMKAKVLEITPKIIRYKHCDNPNGPTYNIAINEVAMIKYKNGTKDTFKQDTQVNTYEPKQQYLVKRRSNSALIFGILAFPLSFLYIGGIICAIIAIVSGRSALRMMQKDPSLYDSSYRHTAKAGVILGIVYLSLIALLIIAFLVVIGLLLSHVI